MFRLLSACALSMMFVMSVVQAADLPTHLPKHLSAKLVKKKKVKVATHKTVALKKYAAVAPVVKAPLPKAPVGVKAPVAVVTTPAKPILAAPKSDSINLSWTLDPLVANADGGKDEGSASTSGNLIIEKPGQKFGPQLTIELIGHVVKTTESVVRIDVQIGSVKRTVTWNADVAKSGSFKIVLDEKLPAGALPETLPASALAFVTKTGDGHAAMISLEKINLRMEKLRLAGSEEE